MKDCGAVVLAQLVERLLLTPEVRGSNSVISQLLSDIYFFTVNCIEKTKIKKKRPGMAHLKNHERLNIRLQSTKDMKNRVERELSDVPT